MRAEVRRIRDAVANKDLVPMLVHFVYNDGLLYASDGEHTAATPLHLDAPRFFILASELHSFLDKISGEPRVIVSDDGTVAVKCGKMSAMFAGLTPGITAFDVLPESGLRLDLPEDFIPRLREVRPFVSENANKPWATCVLMRNGKMLATSNIAVVSADMEIPNEEDLLIPAKVADFLICNSEGLTHMEVSERSLVFRWSDGSWYNTSRFSHAFPAIEATLESLQEAEWEVPNEWREAVTNVMRLGEGQLEIYPDKIVGRTLRGTQYEAETSTPLPDEIECAAVESQYLGPVFSAARHMKIYRTGARVYLSFVTDTLRGVGVGRVK